ncbi:hypothetical protein [Proteus terrae]|uniref:hypothetical protein n=1 Tax=Proteus terrae TaxID=1574161 RepID=UPI00288B44A0|nr:hypothetical protein [Proteus terrae]
MMSIKTDNLRLNKNLINEQNSENKTVFSKKSSSFSKDIGLLDIEKDRLSSEEFSKIKQKLNDFYNLDCKDVIELKDSLKLNIKIKSDKSVGELDDKDEKNDYSNIEGLLLTQRKIYSQICSFSKENKIEKKDLLSYLVNKSNNHNEAIIKNSLKLATTSELKRDGNIDISNNKKTVNENINGLNDELNKDKPNQKLERKNYINNIKENVGIKNYNYELKTKGFENNIVLKNEENKLNVNKHIVIEHDEISEKIAHSNNKEINKNTILMNSENKKSNIESLHKEKIKRDINEIPQFNSIKPESQQMSSEPLPDRKILDIPAFSVLYKKVSTLSQPPSITYVFKKWGSELHQMKVNFDTDKKIQLIASTGRVYQSSLDGISQYQGRLSLSSGNENSHWHINAIDPSSENKEDEK